MAKKIIIIINRVDLFLPDSKENLYILDLASVVVMWLVITRTTVTQRRF